MRFLALSIAACAAASALPAEVSNVDAAPFGHRLAEADAAGIEWPELRRIVRLEVYLAPESPIPAPGSTKAEYWRRVSDGSALRR